MSIGILALQGDYEMHARRLDALKAKHNYVRLPDDLKKSDALIIPGGESTTLLWFMVKNGLWEAIIEFAKLKKPIFGTCAGAILLANKVISPDQKSLGLIDIVLKRNSYGRQAESFIDEGLFLPEKLKSEMVFIRAPRITQIGKNVEIIGQLGDEPVAVKQNNILVATFHPELAEDNNFCWHRYFIGWN